MAVILNAYHPCPRTTYERRIEKCSLDIRELEKQPPHQPYHLFRLQPWQHSSPSFHSYYHCIPSSRVLRLETLYCWDPRSPSTRTRLTSCARGMALSPAASTASTPTPSPSRYGTPTRARLSSGLRTAAALCTPGGRQSL
jgi:hypothetical protein